MPFSQKPDVPHVVVGSLKVQVDKSQHSPEAHSVASLSWHETQHEFATSQLSPVSITPLPHVEVETHVPEEQTPG